MSRAPVKSAVRVLQVLELFSERKVPLALKEVVSELAYPQSSTTNLLKSLVSVGYLHYDRVQRKYMPTFRVANIGAWITDLIDDNLMDLMGRLQERTGETVILGSQNDLCLQYLRVLDSRHVLRFHIREGSLRPLTQTSLGWMLMSEMRRREAEKLCRLLNAREDDPAKRVVVADFLDRLEQVKASGYCYVPHLSELGGGSVAMLLPETIRGQRLVVGVGGLCERLDRALPSILAEMHCAIEDFSQSLHDRGERRATATPSRRAVAL